MAHPFTAMQSSGTMTDNSVLIDAPRKNKFPTDRRYHHTELDMDRIEDCCIEMDGYLYADAHHPYTNQELQQLTTQQYQTLSSTMENDTIFIETVVEKFETLMGNLGRCTWYYDNDPVSGDEGFGDDLIGLSFIEDEDEGLR